MEKRNPFRFGKKGEAESFPLWDKEVNPFSEAERIPLPLSSGFRFPLFYSKGNNEMKLTKEQITEKREELCKVLVAE